MEFVIDQLRLLGLNAREIKVFITLSTCGQCTMTRLAHRAGLPHTTVDAVVKRLHQQGLISRTLVGRHFEWSVDPEEVRERMRLLHGKFKTDNHKNTIEEQVTLSVIERGDMPMVDSKPFEVSVQLMGDIVFFYRQDVEDAIVLQGDRLALFLKEFAALLPPQKEDAREIEK